VYRVDDQPVPLFYGGLPLFRTLATPNTTGRDVRIIADNLRALGYSIGVQPRAAHDGESVLTASLIAAIKRWQTDLHLPPTGHIAPGDVIVQPAAVRVDAVTAQPGDSADAALLSVTPTAKVITVSADPGQAGAIKRNDRVTVELPDSKTAKAKVTGVGTALQTPEAQTGDPDATPKLTVTVTVDDAEQIERLDAGDVQVDFAGETHRGVLVVPVGALVALSEGGYAVQLSDDTLIAVEVGLFAKGLVEVSGDGLTVGAKVVTTS
jgi:peptidoglycan hydrolase-like protein with peptidoglycan-binding domain